MPAKPSFVRSFLLNIVFPSVLTITLFVISIFVVIIPASEKNLLDKKRETICELTNSAWSLLESFHQQQLDNKLSAQEAQNKAISAISALRYGDEGKDYFWITDMHPKMIVHPYRNELDGQDLSDFRDHNGKKLFVEFVEVVEKHGAGFVDYWWQWKDDSTRIVPKLSYVRGFQPWNWIIGTGIYIEDVRTEISRITKRLINISLSIVFIVFFILVYIARQTYKLEKQKQITEYKLAESKEKYKSLVEASTEGTLMIMDNQIIFANQTIQKLLGYSEIQLIQMSLDLLINLEGYEGDAFTSFLYSNHLNEQIEARILKKDGDQLDTLISISHIDIFGKEGFILIAKDTSGHKKIQEELGESKQKFQILTENINLGVFRMQLGKKSFFSEINPAGSRILGIDDQQLTSLTLTDFFCDPDEAKGFMHTLLKTGNIRERVIQLETIDKRKIFVSISAIVIQDDNKNEKFIDGILEDISELKKTEQVREEIITELNTSLMYLRQPVKHFAQFYPKFPMYHTIKNAALDMKKYLASAGLVVSEAGDVVGIVTIDDLWKRVICNEKSLSAAVYEIMSAPVQTLSENALIFEAMLVMQKESIRHLPLTDVNGSINCMITNKEIMQIQQYTAGILVQEIQNSKSIDELVEKSKALPQTIKSLIDSGVLVSTITRIISSVGDKVALKCIEFAIEEIGAPPCDFAFLVLGSQGREEQTFSTDQDNVIILENECKEVHEYFLNLAELVNKWLDQAGYHYCKGDVMAKNLKWCVRLDEWKQYFTHWINEADPQDLIEIGIFFDFRLLYGNQKLVNELRQFIIDTSKGNAPFFNHLAKNSLLVKPPLNLMGNISTKSTDEEPEGVDIKHSLLPIIDFARIYSLQHGVSETNTIQRLAVLREKNIINDTTFEEIIECYEYLMMLRFKHQVDDLYKNRQPDNFINPKRLTQVERHMLKKIFSQINNFQKKMSFDFTGVAL